MLEVDTLPALMTPRELAEVLRTTKNTLAQDRYLGRGVPFIKHGRRILYSRDEVRAYIDRNRRERTEPQKATGAAGGRD